MNQNSAKLKHLNHTNNHEVEIGNKTKHKQNDDAAFTCDTIILAFWTSNRKSSHDHHVVTRYCGPVRPEAPSDIIHVRRFRSVPAVMGREAGHALVEPQINIMTLSVASRYDFALIYMTALGCSYNRLPNKNYLPSRPSMNPYLGTRCRVGGGWYLPLTWRQGEISWLYHDIMSYSLHLWKTVTHSSTDARRGRLQMLDFTHLHSKIKSFGPTRVFV